MKTLTIRRGNFQAVAYTEDGRLLVSLHSGTEVRFWDLETFEFQLGLSLPVQCGRFHNFAVIRRHLLLGSSLWDVTRALNYASAPRKGPVPTPAHLEVPLEEGQSSHVFPFVTPVPGGKSLFGLICRSARPPRTEAMIWDMKGRCLRRFAFGEWPSVALAVAADGRTAAVSGPKCARLLDLAAEGSELASLKHTDYPQALRFSPDGQQLAVAAGRKVWLWDVPGRRLVWCGAAFRRHAESLAFSPDGRLLAAGSREGEVRVWEVGSEREVARHDWKIGAVHGLAFSPDGMTVAAAGHAKTIVIWDVDGP